MGVSTQSTWGSRCYTSRCSYKMAKAAKESKAAQAKKVGKQKKKKWSKGKTREKLQNAVFCDQATFDKLTTEIPKVKLITVSVLSDRLKVNGSLARRCIAHLLENNLIRQVSYHGSQGIYTRNVA